MLPSPACGRGKCEGKKTSCRNGNVRKKMLHDDPDQIAKSGGADGDDEEFQAGYEFRFAREMSLECADAEESHAAEKTREIKRRHAREDDIRNDRNERADDERQPHHQSGSQRLIDFGAAQAKYFFLKGAQEHVSFLA